MAYFSPVRNVERSIIDYLQEYFTTNWSTLGVRVVKGFANAYQGTNPLPLITVDLDDVDYDYIEVGSNQINKIYSFNVNLLARSDGEKLDISEMLFDALVVGCPYLETSYESGTYEHTVTDENGRIRIRIESSTNIELTQAQNVKDKHRFYVNITAKRSSLTSLSEQGLSGSLHALTKELFTATASQTVFTLAHVARTVVSVSIGGITQVEGVDYTVTNSTLTLLSPSDALDKVYIAYYY